MPRWHKIWAVARKEIRDILRDRRTLFMAIIFPLILYPLLIIGLIQVTAVQEQRARRQTADVGVSGSQHGVDLSRRLHAEKSIRVLEFDGERLPPGVAAGIVIPEKFDDDLAADNTAIVTLLYDGANQSSIDSADRLTRVIEGYGNDALSRRLESHGLDMEFVSPVRIRQTDTATPRQLGVFKLGRILAFLLVTFCLMGALYPALDAVSGEKERGTLETLLSIPATRLEILSGKYVAVFAMSVASVAANFVSLTITMLLVNNLLRASIPGDAAIDFRVPTSAVFLLIPALLPLAAFFSAVCLGIAAYAKSTREGQYYLAPLYAAALPLTAVSLVSSVSLTYVTALIPITAISLFLKDGLLGTLSPGPTLVAIASTSIYAALALRWATSVFGREEVLFGAPSGDVEILPEARGIPRPTHAVVAWAVSLILFYYLGTTLAMRLGPLNISTSLIINGLFIFGPAAVLVALERLNWRRVFPLGPLGWRGTSSLLLFIPAALMLNIVAKAVQQYLLSSGVDASEIVATERISVLTLYLSLAALPAFAEEFVYRGFILGSFSARFKGTTAIVISALLFAAAHLNIYEIIPLFVLGVVLALVMRSNGTLIAPITVHFANNFLFVFLVLRYPTLSFEWSMPVRVAVVLGLLAGGVALLWGGIRVAAGSGRGK